MSTDTYYERLDISEALETAGWTPDDENPLEILRKNGACFAIINECGDSGVSAGSWTVEFPTDTPVAVIVAACLAAAEEPTRCDHEQLLTEAARRAAALGWRTITVARLTALRRGDTSALPPDPATAPRSAFGTYRPRPADTEEPTR
ncbi:hypothetical protein [Streptomyces sp. NPDC005989]|uniref:hypothetical protein n=1 Tax=Streptomyces sp. NPDC005989 TaxID=3156727 RepID=UPI0033F332C6